MRIALVFSLVLMLIGCVSAPRVQPVPDALLEASSVEKQTITRAMPFWWLSLQDETLTELIEIGLRESPTTQIALARLAQAKTGIDIAEANALPSLLGLGSRQSRNTSRANPDVRSSLGILSFSWNANLWGKQSLVVNKAHSFENERWFEYQSVLLALSADIAKTYFQIAAQQMSNKLLTDQLNVSEDLEELIEFRFRLGQASANELYQQRESTQTIAQLKIVGDTTLAMLEKRLDASLGRAPDSSPRVKDISLPSNLGMISTDEPRELIRHRADVRAGYARLQQVAAAAGIRFTERLPSLQVSANLTSLAEIESTTEWLGYGFDLTIPVFSGGRLHSLEQQSLEALEEERQHYFALWLAALEEVDSLRHQYQQQRKVIIALESRVRLSRKALDSARDRYILGDQNYLEVLIALRRLQDTDRSLIAEQLRLVTLWVELAEAAGRPLCQDLKCSNS